MSIQMKSAAIAGLFGLLAMAAPPQQSLQRGNSRGGQTVVAAASTVEPAPAPPAPECKGNACDDIVFHFDGCYRIENKGTRRVKVTMGPWSFTVQRGDTHVLIGPGGQCVQSYIGTNTANYEN